MIEACEDEAHLQSVSRSPAVAYHLTTVRRAAAIASSGTLLSRTTLRRPNGYADRDLVRARGEVRLAPDTSVNDCVPLYLSRFQPMFVKLIRDCSLAADDIVAIEISRRVAERSRTFVFSTNPVYEAARYLGSWESVRLPTSLTQFLNHAPWPGMLDADGPRGPARPMIMRQAEVLVRGPVPIGYVTAVWVHPRAVAAVAATFPGPRIVSCCHLVSFDGRPTH
jgi:hypothetical protein